MPTPSDRDPTAPETGPWWAQPIVLVELFALSNIAFLAVDIAIAHAINAFAHPGEWVPIAVSPLASLLLVAGMLLGRRIRPVVREPGGPRPAGRDRAATALGLLAGWLCVITGVAGLVLHLESQFFERRTLASLVYTAPFIAPLAYTGLGLLVILNRSVPARRLAWAQWVTLLAMGGFAGNFVLSLADHAQNGFFQRTEWIGVFAAAFATSALLLAALRPGDRALARATAAILVAQLAVGTLGAGLHAVANLSRPGGTLAERFLFGAPALAPLLFCDLAVLGLLGLWAQSRATVASPAPVVPRPGPVAA